MARPPVQPMSSQEVAARRRGVLRTVWIMASIALAVYVLFLLTGVLGK